MAKKGGNPEYLKPPWQPGQSGNPNGTPGPKSKTVAKALIEGDFAPEVFERIEKLYGVKLTEKNKLKALMESLLMRGAMGDNAAAKEFLDRLDGKALQTVEANVNLNTEEARKKITSIFDEDD